MKHTTLPILISITVAVFFSCYGQSPEERSENLWHEKIIREYFAGWLNNDWSQVSGQLASGFTFTSPAPDDHITTEQFKEKCWNQAAHVQKFDFIKIIGNEHEAFAIIHVITKDHNIIRNTEYFRFSNGKIKSIEVFFGGTGRGFPTNTRE